MITLVFLVKFRVMSRKELLIAEPLSLERLRGIFEKLAEDEKEKKGDESLTYWLERMDLSPAKDGFLYEMIDDMSGEEKPERLYVYVALHDEQGRGPNDEGWTGLGFKLFGPQSSFSEEKKQEIEGLEKDCLLKITAGREVMHKILGQGEDPVRMAIMRKVRIKGDMSFVIRFPRPVKEFIGLVGKEYQEALSSSTGPTQLETSAAAPEG